VYRFVPLSLTVLLIISCGRSEKSDGQKSAADSVHVYYVGLIKMGPAWTPDITPALERLQEAHQANISELSESGKLALAGLSWSDSGDAQLRGLLFFDTENEREARLLAAADPTVQAGRFVVEIFPWYGPARIEFDQPLEIMKYKMILYFQGAHWSAKTQPVFDSLARWQISELQKYDPEAKSVLSGSFKKSILAQSPLSLFIYEADSLSWLESVANSCLPVRRGILEPIVLHWYGPAGLNQ